MSRIGPDLLGQLFNAHAPALLLYARELCEAPEDVVQEAFISLARQHRLPDQIKPWLYRVVRNGALTAARGERRRLRREARASDADEVWFASAEDQIDARHAESLLSELEPEIREVIVARIWGGLTFEEMARALGCSLSTAYRRYQAGLAQLHERLESHERHGSPLP